MTGMTTATTSESVKLGDRVRYEVPAPRVARATLTRSEAGNLQDVHLFYQLDAAYRRAAADDAISVLVLAAEGDDFSLGHDVEALFTTDGMEQVTLEAGFSRGASRATRPGSPRSSSNCTGAGATSPSRSSQPSRGGCSRGA